MLKKNYVYKNVSTFFRVYNYTMKPLDHSQKTINSCVIITVTFQI